MDAVITEGPEADAPVLPPPDWRPLAVAYNAHHFHCFPCRAAARGAGYGQRCETGVGLWLAYQEAATAGKW